MLQETIEADGPYSFLVERSARPRIIFATREMIAAREPVDPLRQREASDEQSFTALVRWAGVRRARWSDWGKLAERIGPTAFDQHMCGLMDAEPPVLVTGSVIQRSHDPLVIVVAEMVQGRAGLKIEALYHHKFASAGQRHRFYDWFYTDRNCDLAADLIQIAYSAGTAALGEVLDRLATDGAKPNSRAERRRRAKAAARIDA